MSIRNFQWKNPTTFIIKENGSPEIANYIAQDKVTKVLVLYGQSSIKKIGLYDKVIDSSRQNNIKFWEIQGVRANPEIKTVCKAIDVCRDNSLQAILAIGGGSVIDSAKAIAVGATFDKGIPATSIWQCFEGKRKIENAIPIYTVLTISAAGSETNGATSVADDDQRKKWYFGSELVYPKVSIADPIIQQKLPWYQQVNGFVDAMMHIFERSTNLKRIEEVELTFSMNISILKSMVKAGDKLQKDNEDYAARANFIWAASCATSGLCQVGCPGPCTGCHGIEMAVSAINPDVSHGAGLAVVFPEFVRANAKRGFRLDIYDQLAQGLYNKQGWQGLIDGFIEMVKRWGHPTTLRELYGREITKADRDEILRVFMLRPGCNYFENKLMPEDLAKEVIDRI